MRALGPVPKCPKDVRNREVSLTHCVKVKPPYSGYTKIPRCFDRSHDDQELIHFVVCKLILIGQHIGIGIIIHEQDNSGVFVCEMLIHYKVSTYGRSDTVDASTLSSVA